MRFNANDALLYLALAALIAAPILLLNAFVVAPRDRPVTKDNFTALMLSAELGDPGKQYAVGRALKTGTGVAADPRKAATWFRSAAEQGHAASQYELGMMLMSGRDVPKDEAEGVRLLTRAATQRMPRAAVTLCDLYKDGKGGLQKEENSAFHWCSVAAQAGDAEGAYKLGVLYLGASVNRQDMAAGVRNLVAAALRGSPEARALLEQQEKLCREGKDKSKMTACVLYAETGDPFAQRMAAYAYYRGFGAEKDPLRAVSWYRKAAEQGDVASQLALASMYVNGEGVPGDLIEAYAWYAVAFNTPGTAKLRQQAAQGMAQMEIQLTPERRLLAEQRARELTAKHGKNAAAK